MYKAFIHEDSYGLLSHLPVIKDPSASVELQYKSLQTGYQLWDWEQVYKFCVPR
jgi:hypothetical protein